MASQFKVRSLLFVSAIALIGLLGMFLSIPFVEAEDCSDQAEEKCTFYVATEHYGILQCNELTNSEIQPLIDECEDNSNLTNARYSCVSRRVQGETVVQSKCVWENAYDGTVWGQYSKTDCYCDSSPSENSVAAVAQKLGLEGISTSGIFAGKLSVNEIVQFVILMVLSVLMLVLLFIIIKNGIAYAGSGDDEQKKKGAIKGITNALIGAGIVFGSYFILSIFFSFFGLSPFKKLVPIESCNDLIGDAKDRCEALVNED